MVEHTGAFARYGRGSQPVQQEPLVKTWRDFSAGLVVSDAPEDVPENASPSSVDMEVTEGGRLRRAPGTTEMEEYAAHFPSRVLLHTSLEDTAEILLWAPPYLGRKRTDEDTIWTDFDLDDDWFSGVNFGGTFVFTDGTKVYSRQPNELTVDELEEAPVARTYASFAGRIFAGHSLIDGSLEPLGISWSAAGSDYRDWTGLGAQFELLINEILAGDQIVALRPMGFEFMAVILKNSVWIARFTGQVERPADFQPRVTGVGSVSERTCRTGMRGVFFLSYDGVYVFDGNQAVMISKQINDELLPLDMENLESYHAVYDQVSKRYILFTPTETWIFHIEEQRWLKRSLIATDALMFPLQIGSISWGEAVGSWGAQDQDWFEYAGAATGDFSLVLLGNDLDTDNPELASEDQASETYFGNPMTPRWDFQISEHELVDKLMTIQHMVLRYQADVDSEVDFYLPSNSHQYELVDRLDLEAATAPLPMRVPVLHTGKGMGLRLEVAHGDPEIILAQLQGVARGPFLEAKVTDRSRFAANPSLAAATEYGDVANGDLFDYLISVPNNPAQQTYREINQNRAIGASVVDEDERWIYSISIGTNFDTWYFQVHRVGDFDIRAELDLVEEVFEGSLPFSAVHSQTMRYDPDNKVIYVFEGQNHRIAGIDVSDPLNPELVHAQAAGSTAIDAKMWDFYASPDHTHLYLADDTGFSNPHVLRIHTIDTPGRVGTEIGNVQLGTGETPKDLLICPMRTDWKHAFVLMVSANEVWLYVVNVEDPSDPVLVSGPHTLGGMSAANEGISLFSSAVDPRVFLVLQNEGANWQRQFVLDFEDLENPTLIFESPNLTRNAAERISYNSISAFPNESYLLHSGIKTTFRVVADPFTEPVIVAEQTLSGGTSIATRYGAGYSYKPE